MTVLCASPSAIQGNVIASILSGSLRALFQAIQSFHHGWWLERSQFTARVEPRPKSAEAPSRMAPKL